MVITWLDARKAKIRVITKKGKCWQSLKLFGTALI